MYDTCETSGENMSEIENVTAHDQTKVLTSAPKIESLHESPELRRSKAIAVILIESGVD
jgi:hypothetical protein